MTKWTLYVRARRTRKTIWRAAKEALVATIMEGVGPGVKMELTRSVKKVAIVEASKLHLVALFKLAFYPIPVCYIAYPVRCPMYCRG